MIKIYLSDISLDVNQEEISIKKTSPHKIYNLIDGSQSIMPTKAKLDIIEFSGFIYNVSHYNKILDLISANAQTSLLITGLNRQINYKVVITDFKTTESGGDLFCIDYTIKFMEYKKCDFYKIGTGSNITQSGVSSYDSYSAPSNYVVVKGDNLYNIAKRFLGNGNRYMELATKNNIKNPALIYPGQVIVF